MIAFLSGKPEVLTHESVIIHTGQVGYKVFLYPKLLSILPEKLDLYIHTQVRDDTLDLYGFPTKEELNLFKVLIAISGIGPKIGIAILEKGVTAITSAVSRADVDFFTSVPRLGKKNAQKIIIDLKPRLGDLEALDLTGDSSPKQPAIEALMGLGFTKKEAQLATKDLDPELPMDEIIKTAIKSLGKNHG